MRKWLFLISVAIVCFYSCKTASENKSNTAKEKKDFSLVGDSIINDTVNKKEDTSIGILIPKEVKRDAPLSERKSGDTTKREKKIIHKHNSPDQQEIDSLKKAKGKKKFNKE